MGKYIRKAKTTSDVAVMDLSFGVRTRAKTLALQQRQLQPQPPSSSPTPTSSAAGAGGYLQLRSRRLVKKPPILVHVSKRQKHAAHHHNANQLALNPSNNNHNSGSNNYNYSNSNSSGSRVRISPPNSITHGSSQKKQVEGSEIRGDEEERNKSAGAAAADNNNNESKDLGIEEASFGENVLDVEGRERSTRESTPCSLIRDPESIRTPGSTTKPSSNETNRRIQNSMRRHIPTAHEMDEFFTGAEEEHLRRFVEKYNFDPVNDKPLPGRYEWKKLDP